MTAGIDVAKNILQVRGVNEHGETVLRKQFKRHHVCHHAVALDRYGGLEAPTIIVLANAAVLVMM